MPERIGLEAVLDDKKFQSGIKQMLASIEKAGRATDQLADVAEDAGKDIDDMGDDMLEASRDAIDLAAKMIIVREAMDAVSDLARQGLELAKLGATSERIERRFEAFAEKGGGAVVMMEAFQEGAGGAASKMEAMQSASMLLQMGLVKDAEGMEELVTMATRLGDQTLSVTARVENFALTLANQSKPRLDSFGISAGRVTQLEKELMAANQDLTKEQAFLAAVQIEGAKSLEILGERVADSAMTFEIMEARMADAKVELGQKLAPVFADAIGLFGDFGDQAYMVMGVLGEFGGTIVKLAPLLPVMGKGLLGVAKAMKSVNLIALATNPVLLALAAAVAAVVAIYITWDKWNKKIEDSAQRAVDAADETSEKMSLLVDAGGEVVDVFRDTGEVTNRTAEAWNNMHPAAQALSGVFGAHSKILKVVKERNFEVIEAAMQQGKTYPEVIKLIDLYNSQIEDSAWHIKGFTEQKYNAIKAMEDFQTVAGDVGLGILDMTQLLLDGEYANILLDQSTLELGYTLDAAGYATQDLNLKMMQYIDTMDDAVPKTMEHGDALDRYIDKQDAAAVAAEEAAVVADKAAEDTKKALEELVKAQDAAKEAAFRHREGVLKLAESLSGPGVEAEAVFRASLVKLKQMQEDGLISEELYLRMTEKLNEQFGFTDEGGRFFAKGIEHVGEVLHTGLLKPQDYGAAIEILNSMARSGVTDVGDFKDKIAEFETPAEAAARRTEELFTAITEGEEPTRRTEQKLARLLDTTTFSADPTEALKDRTVELRDESEPLPEVLDEVEEAIDDLSQAFLDTQAPFDDLILRIYQLPEDVMIVSEEMFKAGKALVRRLEDGIDWEWKNVLMPKKEAMLNAFAEQFHSSSEPKDPDSPLHGFFQKGAALVQTYIEGLESEFPNLSRSFANLFEFGGVIGGLGGAAAGILSKQQRVLQERMRFIDSEMQRLAGIWGVRGRGRGGDLYLSILDEISGGYGEWYFQALKVWEMAGTLTDKQREQLFQYRALNELIVERNATEREYEEMQARITRMKEAQQRLRFLEQQVKLLELISEHGLNAQDILMGLQLGAQASAEEVLAAMTRAMEEVIKQAEEKLGIHSESAVFRKFGQQLMHGLTMGIEDMMALPVRQSAIATRAMMSAPAAMAGISTQNIDNSRTVNLRAGGNQFYTGMDETAYGTRTTRAVSRALRGW